MEEKKTVTLSSVGLIIGFPVSSQYLRTLGIEPDGKFKNSLLYSADKIPLVAQRIIDKMQKVIDNPIEI